MPHTKILALIMAGGAGSRMEVLTKVRAKPALPYAGVYRLIDFPLSHCVHSAISDVWIVEQFQPQSLNDHLVNGRPWDLDRTYGGLRVLPPFTGTPESGWHQGNADAIFRNKRFIREFAPDLLVVLSADHIYKLDYRQVIDAHLSHHADVTLVTTQVPLDQASRFGTVQVNAQGKVTQFAYKPEQPQSTTVTTEVFVYNAPKLLDTLDELVARKRGASDDENATLKDFGHELLPLLVETGHAFAFPLDGYWRDVGTIDSYWASHMDLLADEPPLNLDEPNWPILTFGSQRLPARIAASARIEDSLIAPGCQIRGHVAHSVLGPGVIVEQGAVVRNAIVFHDTIIAAGATVDHAIVDSQVRIGARAQVGARAVQADHVDRNDDRPEIAVVGQRVHLPEGARVASGERVQPVALADETD